MFQTGNKARRIGITAMRVDRDRERGLDIRLELKNRYKANGKRLPKALPIPTVHQVRESMYQRFIDASCFSIEHYEVNSGEYAFLVCILDLAVRDILRESPSLQRDARYFLTRPDNWVYDLLCIDHEYIVEQLKKHLLI